MDLPYPTIVIVSDHPEPSTGAHHRLDRLVHALAKSERQVLWLTPYREEFASYPNATQFYAKRQVGDLLPTQIALVACALKHARARRKTCSSGPVVKAFGQTNLLAAYLLGKHIGASLSLGVRNDVFQADLALENSSSTNERRLPSVALTAKVLV